MSLDVPIAVTAFTAEDIRVAGNSRMRTSAAHFLSFLSPPPTEMLPETVAKLAAHPNIAGIVDGGTPSGRVKQLRELCGKDFAVPTGTVADKLVTSKIPDARFKYFNSVLDAAMAVKAGKADAAAYDGILLSPGPGTPAEAGVCIDIVRELGGQVPIFGVCLGHQCIGEAFGGDVVSAGEIMHGKTSLITHDNRGVFAGLPSPFEAIRYHSLAIKQETLPASLEVSARSESGITMGVRHREYVIEGVQFHPESIMTQHGHQLLQNFLNMRQPVTA